MSDALINQIQFENTLWKKIIFSMMDENVQLKLRLAEILNTKHDQFFLERAEKFQNCFVELDQGLLILRNHLAGLDKLAMKRDGIEEAMPLIKSSMFNFRNNMTQTILLFNTQRLDFNNYLLSFFELENNEAKLKKS